MASPSNGDRGRGGDGAGDEVGMEVLMRAGTGIEGERGGDEGREGVNVDWIRDGRDGRDGGYRVVDSE